jgi:hypothetical protein
MTSNAFASVLAAAVLGASALAACTQNAVAPGGTSCSVCAIDSDCAGGVCSQLGGASYCASACSTGADCAAGEQCLSVSAVTGDPATVCVQVASTTCGPNVQPPPTPDSGPTNSCPGFADPNTASSCTSCTTKTQSNCQANGCYGGWWCNEQTQKCEQAPANCSGPTSGGPPPPSYPGFTSTIDANGGAESLLYFGVVGDSRPATEDDTAHYPTAVVSKIFQDLGALTPPPPFLVSTGDYQFSNPHGSQAHAQLQTYLNARTAYAGIQFPTMGNHECTGGTTSNCGAGNTDGITNNYSAFMADLLGPLQKTTPYYVINVNEPANAWTAKFVFVAANAWDGVQASWLDQALAQPTTYTFIVRHEPANASTTLGVSGSETIMAKYPYTLAIVGHTHEYRHSNGSREVIIGNGGAPLSNNGNFGYALVAQRPDGALTIDMYDYASNASDTAFHFAVKPDGTSTN